MKRFNYILFLLLFVFACTNVGAQVFIGDGVTISKGTTIHINNQDVIINTHQISGEGTLSIINEGTQQLNIAKDLKTEVDVDVQSKSIKVHGESKTHFALHFLPPLTPEVIAAKEKERLQENLPVRYVNFEGKTFKIDEEEKNQQEPKITMGLEDFSTVVVIVDVLQVKGAQLIFDYNLPIYSLSFNNERFSDYAELYEFKCLTALLKPPIV